jgi:ATP-dependent Clp protease ATP-binding subunit ClpA
MFTTKETFDLGQMVLFASGEAKRRGDRTIGTDHLAVALVSDPESITARALGITLDEVRAGLREVDRQVLASIGIVADFAGPVLPADDGRRLRLSPAATTVFRRLRKVSKGQKTSVRHVLLVLLDQQPPDAAAELLNQLGIDRAEVRRRLQELS